MTETFAQLLQAAAPADRQIYLNYYQAPLPSAQDAAFSQMSEAYQRLTPAAREAAALALTPEQVNWLSTYAYRMAMLSVRQENLRHLHNGLVAMLLAQPNDDWRESLMTLTLLYRSAELLGVGAAAFEAAAPFAPTGLARQQLLSFITAPVEAKGGVEDMGWQEFTGPHGLVYVYSGQEVPQGLL